MASTVMIQGAGSNVGKSMLVAGFARVFVRRGLTVRPFKPQNMSNNAAVTPGGHEIGAGAGPSGAGLRRGPQRAYEPHFAET